jgi:hypothetical protein
VWKRRGEFFPHLVFGADLTSHAISAALGLSGGCRTPAPWIENREAIAKTTLIASPIPAWLKLMLPRMMKYDVAIVSRSDHTRVNCTHMMCFQRVPCPDDGKDAGEDVGDANDRHKVRHIWGPFSKPDMESICSGTSKPARAHRLRLAPDHVNVKLKPVEEEP